jgi:hypothetical protein
LFAVPAAYLAVADEAYGRQIPFAFLERVADAFMEKFGEKGRTAAEGSLNASFRCAAASACCKRRCSEAAHNGRHAGR